MPVFGIALRLVISVFAFTNFCEMCYNSLIFKILHPGISSFLVLVLAALLHLEKEDIMLELTKGTTHQGKDFFFLSCMKCQELV